MKMKKLHAILIASLLPFACIGQTTGLSTRVSLHGFHKFEKRSLFEFLAQRSGLQIKITDNAFGEQDPDHPTYLGVFAVFRDIPIRYPLSWALHFSPDISAELKDGVLVVRPSGDQQDLSPELRAYAEPGGSWTNSLILNAIVTTKQEFEKWDVIQLFEYLCHRAGAQSLVIDPALQAQGKTVSMQLDGRTIHDLMQSLMEQTGTDLRHQGGVLFLTTKTENAQQSTGE